MFFIVLFLEHALKISKFWCVFVFMRGVHWNPLKSGWCIVGGVGPSRHPVVQGSQKGDKLSESKQKVRVNVKEKRQKNWECCHKSQSIAQKKFKFRFSSFQVSLDDDIWGFWYWRHYFLNQVSTDSWLDLLGVNFKHRNILQVIEKLKSIIWVRTPASRCLQLYLKVCFVFDLKVNLCIAFPSKQCRQ